MHPLKNLALVCNFGALLAHLEDARVAAGELVDARVEGRREVAEGVDEG